MGHPRLKIALRVVHEEEEMMERERGVRKGWARERGSERSRSRARELDSAVEKGERVDDGR